MKRAGTIVCVVVLTALAGSCSQSRETKLLRSAADAMGGADRIQAIKTLSIEGEGDAPNLGQNITPDAELPNWKVTGYKRVIDFEHRRMRTQQRRDAEFLFAGATTQHQDQSLDGDVAFNTGEDGVARRAGDAAAHDRRIDMLRHPVAIVRAALEPGAKLGNLRSEAGRDLIDVGIDNGGVTLGIDRESHLPAFVRRTENNDNLGDVEVTTSFSDWEIVNGVNLPRRLTTKIDKYPQFDLRVSKNTVDGEIGDLAAPAAVRSADAPKGAAPQTVDAQEVGKGIWWLAGSGNHRSVLFEFDDHLTLFEVPVNEARSAAVIAKARSLRPEKPLTEAIVSHHHFDHSGGLRTAVAEGLTIVTYRGNVDFFKELVARPHTLMPDELQMHPQPLKIRAVDDQLTLKDKSMEVRLYHVIDNPREGTLLFAYVPRDRMLVQADLYDSTWLQHPWADNFLWNLKMRHLAVEKHVPVHGTIQTHGEVLATLRSKGALSGNSTGGNSDVHGVCTFCGNLGGASSWHGGLRRKRTLLVGFSLQRRLQPRSGPGLKPRVQAKARSTNIRGGSSQETVPHRRARRLSRSRAPSSPSSPSPDATGTIDPGSGTGTGTVEKPRGGAPEAV